MADKTDTLKSRDAEDDVLGAFNAAESPLDDETFELATATIDESDTPDENELHTLQADTDLDLTPPKGISTDDPVRMYLREIGTIPLLSGDQEVRLAETILAGGAHADRAKRKLAEANLRLVVSILCTGMRMVRAWSAIERVIACRIHQVA